MIQIVILYLTISSFVVLLICDTTKVSAQTVTIMSKEQLVGGDRDKHGCIGSAGYTWSNIQNKCVRIFEVGIRLNPSQLEPNQAVISAFILFNKNQRKAELFISNQKSIILSRKTTRDHSFWANKNFKLFPLKENNGYFLKDGDKTIYSTSESKLHTIE